MRGKLGILFVFFIVIFLSSCKNEQPILIGFSNTISGVSSELGVNAMYGAEMAVLEINENGGIHGRQVELVIRDDEGDMETAIAVDNELKDLGCVAIIGHGLSSVASGIVENANKNDIELHPKTWT